MFSFVGIVGLVFFIFVRPQELYPQLAIIPWIYVFFGLAVFGLVVDLRLRLIKPEPAPPLLWAVLFVVWCGFTAVLKAQDAMAELLVIVILFAWYFLISHGVQGFPMMRALGAVLLVLSLYLSLIGVHQHHAPNQCIATVAQDSGLPSEFGTPDGRPCGKPTDCYGKGAEPGKEYLCERVGLFSTTSITQRVRYVGILKDPNDLALTVALSLPLLVVFVQRRRTPWRIILALMAAALTLLCVYYSRSRGAQLVTAAVLGVYFIRRFRWRGIIAAAIIGAVLFSVVVKKRAGDADDSASRRIEHMYEGMTMFKYAPLVGVGTNQFPEHHYQTAHNAYVLTLAEQGLVGMFLWMTMLYTSFKVPIAAYRRYRNKPEAKEARDWALALTASLSGLYVGIFFLSFSYHYVLWCYQGIAAAYYRSVKLHDPEWHVPFRLIDAFIVALVTVVVVFGLFAFTRVMLPPV